MFVWRVARNRATKWICYDKGFFFTNELCSIRQSTQNCLRWLWRSECTFHVRCKHIIFNPNKCHFTVSCDANERTLRKGKKTERRNWRWSNKVSRTFGLVRDFSTGFARTATEDAIEIVCQFECTDVTVQNDKTETELSRILNGLVVFVCWFCFECGTQYHCNHCL